MTALTVRIFWDILKIVMTTVPCIDPSFVIQNCQVRFIVLMFGHLVTPYSALAETYVIQAFIIYTIALCFIFSQYESTRVSKVWGWVVPVFVWWIVLLLHLG